MARIGIIGGSFNPPHVGHAALCQYALAFGLFDEILISPCYKHPFKDNLLPFNDRVEMCKIVVKELLPKSVTVVDYEKDIGTGYTYDLIIMLKDNWPHDHYTLILGTDLVDEINNWHRGNEIEDLARIFWVKRTSGGMTLPVSSVEIRDLIGRGESVSKMVPRKILKYLSDNNLLNKLGSLEK